MRLVEVIHSLPHRFRDELSGARQATRTQVVRFLATQLCISEQAADTLFEELCLAGVIGRRNEVLEENGRLRDECQQWAFNSVGETEIVSALEQKAHLEPMAGHDGQAIELLRRAIQNRATDVHLTPFGDEVEVRFRVDGRLEHYCRLDAAVGRQLMAQFKVMASVDSVEPFRAHEGRLNVPAGLSDFDIRITSTPVALGESVALRLLSRDQIIRPLATLGFSSQGLEQLTQAMKGGEGMVVVGGPSGAGKTTTLYSVLHYLDNGHQNIATIEDPVEHIVPEFLQVQVDLRHGRSLTEGLRTLLRMDTDMVLIGEIRDIDTATAAMQAASCGKHIFSGVHARDVAAVVTCLRDLNVTNRSLASNLRAIISQRLVRRLCEQCRSKRALCESDRELFNSEGISAPVAVPQPVGCDACRGSGYYDRIGIFEIAIVQPETATAIASGEGEQELRQRMRTEGAVSLMADGLHKVCEGITTLEEIQTMCWPQRQPHIFKSESQ